MSKELEIYKIVGLMSGSSLDGLDICLAHFWLEDEQWKYDIVSATTVEYSKDWKKRLVNAKDLDGIELSVLDREYGTFLGTTALNFLNTINEDANYIASHGHTIFHQIDKKLSLQIGHGAFLSASSGLKTISDFRSLDTAYGGQGAPLVPTAEKYLFPEINYFLNIGGIANISVHQEEKILGFDICPANQVLNYLSRKYFDIDYDKNGEIARSGELNTKLLEELNKIKFYHEPAPKSLGREFTEIEIYPILDQSELNGSDLLCTYTHHIAEQMAASFKEYAQQPKVMISGGGAYNQFLIELLEYNNVQMIDIDDQLINFKEALSFAFLGLLRIQGEPNVLSTISGASKDSCGGSIFFP